MCKINEKITQFKFLCLTTKKLVTIYYALCFTKYQLTKISRLSAAVASLE